MHPVKDDDAITHQIPAERAACRKAKEKRGLVTDVIDKINDTRLDRDLVVEEHKQKLEDLEQLCRHDVLKVRKPKLPRRQDIPGVSPLVLALDKVKTRDCVVEELAVKPYHELATKRLLIGYEPREKLTDFKESSEVYGLVSVGEACLRLNESYHIQRKASKESEKTLQLARQNLRDLLVFKTVSRQKSSKAEKSGPGLPDKPTQPVGQGSHRRDSVIGSVTRNAGGLSVQEKAAA